MALTLPVTVVCAIFAGDLIAVLLGSRWTGSADIFPILAPTILVFAVANPLGWLLNSLRLVCARFEIAVVLAPFLIVGYVIALPYDQKRGRTRLFNDHDVIGRLPQHLGCARHRGLCPVDAGPSPGFKRRGRGHRLLGCTSFMGPSLLPRPAMEMFLFGVAYLVVLFDHKEYITRT